MASSITKVAQPQYQYPIHFYIVHGKSPNAFAVAGGNIYIVDSLFYFVHNTEELAGTLCHETSHLIHHDAVQQSNYDQQVQDRELVAILLFGGRLGTVLATNAMGKLDALHYTREIEERADLTGADTCAQAGYNPWGLVWLFNDFANARGEELPEIFSDHPNDPNRVAALKQYFTQNPSRFARFSSNPKTAKPLKVPKNAAETMLK